MNVFLNAFFLDGEPSESEDEGWDLEFEERDGEQ
jgi:hypothetical protein